MTAPSTEALETATRGIEHWLLESAIQIVDGDQCGGIAGWLDQDGHPEFVYLEIAGYYLMTMTWLAEEAATSAESAALAIERGRHTARWMREATAGGAMPPTRLHLTPDRVEWRNLAIFSFDLAMAARGAARFAMTADVREADELVPDLLSAVRKVCADAVPLRSHALREDRGATVPDRWSTRPGPHHVKAAAALLPLSPAGDHALIRTCCETVAHWTARIDGPWPCRELHPRLYGLEGVLMLNPTSSARMMGGVERAYEHLMREQAADGTLPAATGASGQEVRADVLAQALRIGQVLRATRRLADDEWVGRLDALAGALLRHVRADGSVTFSAEHPVANAWCAMFAHQALVFHLRARRGMPLATRANELLI